MGSFFQIYPNPSDDYITISADRTSGESFVEIINAEGRLVIASQTVGSKKIISLKELPRGLYFVRVYGNGFSSNSKLIKL